MFQLPGYTVSSLETTASLSIVVYTLTDSKETVKDFKARALTTTPEAHPTGDSNNRSIV